MSALSIRSAHPGDLPAILATHRDAFGLASAEIERLVCELLADPTAQPVVSLLAEVQDTVVGHVLLTTAMIEPAGHRCTAYLLAPLAVVGGHQRQGVGGALIRESFTRSVRAGIDLIFVLGHPNYYPRFGFRPAGELGLVAPYLIEPQNAPAWMVHELKPGVIGTVQGKVCCAVALDRPEYWRE
jgi:predicted N-acetyltransferase YhbS